MTISSAARMSDTLISAGGFVRPQSDLAVVRGIVHYVLTGPDGEVKLDETVENMITQVGDQVYGERGAGIGGAPAAAIGMQLGTGVTAPAKTGAGAVLVTPVAASYKVLNPAAGVSSLSSGVRRITYTAQWIAGEATANGISEAVLVNLATMPAVAANTLSRALLSPTVNKGASDTLTITWHHDIGTP